MHNVNKLNQRCQACRRLRQVVLCHGNKIFGLCMTQCESFDEDDGLFYYLGHMVDHQSNNACCYLTLGQMQFIFDGCYYYGKAGMANWNKVVPSG